MVRLLILVVLAFLVFAGLRGVLAKRQLTVRQFFAIYFVVLVALSLLFMAVTGRLHPIFAVLGAVLPFLSNIMGWVFRGAQFAAMLRGLRNMGMGMPTGSAANAPDKSEITSRFIHMVLFHDTGMMDGTVREGEFKDRKLSTLETDELRRLLQACEADADSYNLLTAYLDREHEGWQTDEHGEQSERQSPVGDSMTESRALEILGLTAGATRKEITHAHKSLMQKFHPDRGGSTYLAAQINAAKDFLLGKIK